MIALYSATPSAATSPPKNPNDSEAPNEPTAFSPTPQRRQLMASSPDQVSWISTSSVDPNHVHLDAHYHARNVTSTVHFQRAIETVPSFTLFVEVGSSKSLLGQITRTRGLHDNDKISILGLVTVGNKETESIYLNYNLLRTALFNAGYVGAYGLHRAQEASGVNSNMPFESETAWALIQKTIAALKGCLDQTFVQKEAKFTVDDVRRALDSCARAAKPRENMVLHSLRRAMCLMSQSLSSIVILRPLIRALSLRESEAAAVAGGLLLLLEFSPPTTMTWSGTLHTKKTNSNRGDGSSSTFGGVPPPQASTAGASHGGSASFKNNNVLTFPKLHSDSGEEWKRGRATSV